MKELKIIIGDSMRGYTHAMVKEASTGRYTLVKGSVYGLKYLAVSAVRGLNEDDKYPTAETSAGDIIPVTVL